MTTINKKVLIPIILVSIFCFVVYLNHKNFQAKFFNKTGENIDSLMIGNTLIGKLKKGGIQNTSILKNLHLIVDSLMKMLAEKLKEKQLGLIFGVIAELRDILYLMILINLTSKVKLI